MAAIEAMPASNAVVLPAVRYSVAAARIIPAAVAFAAHSAAPVQKDHPALEVLNLYRHDLAADSSDRVFPRNHPADR
jgi:hypothetical protein